MTRAILLSCTLLLTVAVARADVVHLADGRTIEGETRWVDRGRKLQIKTAYGAITVERHEVLKVEAAGPSAQAELQQRERKLEAEDWQGRFELAAFALEHELSDHAERLWKQVAGGADDALAEQAGKLLEEHCDYHLVEGDWLSPDDYYRGLGYLKVDGTWTPPEEVPFDVLREAYAEEVLDLVNVQRKAEGLKPLRRDRRAEQTAQGHAEDMAEHNYFNHTGRDGSNPQQRAQRAKCRMKWCGENIAAAQKDPAAVVEGWMNSPPHRRNILKPEFTHLGVGIARGTFRNQENELYWVQVFLGR